jgi:hypothetical protein
VNVSECNSFVIEWKIPKCTSCTYRIPNKKNLFIYLNIDIYRFSNKKLSEADMIILSEFYSLVDVFFNRSRCCTSGLTNIQNRKLGNTTTRMAYPVRITVK